LAAEQRIRRFAGWSLTGGGVGFALASAWAPFEEQQAIATSFLGACVLLVILRIARDRKALFTELPPAHSEEGDRT
jgi:hypothetical protein